MEFLNLMKNRLKPKEVSEALNSNMLPEVSASDDGKLLGVVSGEWGKVNAPSGGGVDYSTSEQDTGIKWVDGKAIYSKTFIEAGGSDNTVTIQTGLTNVSKVIKVEGVVTRASSAIYQFPALNIDSLDYSCELQVAPDASYLKVIGRMWKPTDIAVTIYYTKETVTRKRTSK